MTDRLIEAAKDAAAFAYAPYSRFGVGAAIELTDGRIVTGANVENASYGLSLCAEAVAVAKAANMGMLAEIVAVAVFGPAPSPVLPCGRCRQMLSEAAQCGQRDIIVYGANATDKQDHRLSQLLPRAFGPKDLA